MPKPTPFAGIGQERCINLKLRLSDDIQRLLAGVVAVTAGLSSVLLGASPITFSLGLLLLFFLPGYAITRLVFTGRVKLDLFLLLSIGLSVMTAMLAATALALIGILTQDSSVIVLVGITIIALMADKLVHYENRNYEIMLSMARKEDLDPIVTVGIAFGIVLILIFSYIILTGKPPSTTYVALLSEEMDLNLPKNATVGDRVNFTLQLKNGEGRDVSFRVEIFVNGTMERWLIYSLGNGENMTYLLNATMFVPGYQKVELKVYIDDVYYREVHFWVNVVEP